jgi:hypothetical protein
MSKKTETDELILEKESPVKTTGFSLPRKRIIISFYPRPTAMVRDPKHILYGGLGPNAKKYFQLGMLSTGGLINPFETTAEREYLEDKLGLEKGRLSPKRLDNNFFHEYSFFLDKSDKVLDLSDPEDYLLYLVAKTQSDFIAPKANEIRNKVTYMWYFKDEAEDVIEKVNRISTRSEAWKEFGKIEDSASKLRHIMIQWKGSAGLPTNANRIEWLIGEVSDLVESDPTLFLSIVKDPNINYKVDVYEAIQKGVFKKKGLYYYNSDDSIITQEGVESTLDNVVEYLKDPKNNTFYVTIKQRIQNA